MRNDFTPGANERVSRGGRRFCFGDLRGKSSLSRLGVLLFWRSAMKFFFLHRPHLPRLFDCLRQGAIPMP